MILGPRYSSTDIKGYLHGKESNYVVIDHLNQHTLVKFQKWGVLIVKIVTKHFGHNLADKASKFIPNEKIKDVKLICQKHLNTLILNGHPVVAWKTFSNHVPTYRKLNQLVKKFNQSGSGKH